VLRITTSAYAAMIGHAYDGLPDEACGVMGGRFDRGSVEVFVPARNADASSRTYSIGPDGWLAADRVLGPLGLEVVGVMHSHTHTEAYPSPTDVARADNPLLEGWHYVIVSLRYEEPVLRSFLIDGEQVREERVTVVAGPSRT
jgi:[CysO sulfur-carrier protein]-S-L-cysteine hydrolase